LHRESDLENMQIFICNLNAYLNVSVTVNYENYSMILFLLCRPIKCQYFLFILVQIDAHLMYAHSVCGTNKRLCIFCIHN